MPWCKRCPSADLCVENEYMDRLELRSSTDRTLGVGVVEKEASLLVLTAATMMKTEIDPDEVALFHPEYVSGEV